MTFEPYELRPYGSLFNVEPYDLDFVEPYELRPYGSLFNVEPYDLDFVEPYELRPYGSLSNVEPYDLDFVEPYELRPYGSLFNVEPYDLDFEGAPPSIPPCQEQVPLPLLALYVPSAQYVPACAGTKEVQTLPNATKAIKTNFFISAST